MQDREEKEGGGEMNGQQIVQLFREEHSRDRQHTRGIDELISALDELEPISRAAVMRKVAQFFEDQILPHGEWEEGCLYPLLDQWGDLEQSPTSPLREEHRLLARYSHELSVTLAKPHLDPREFSLRAEQLVGLTLTHLEREEALLLPLLAQRLHPAEPGLMSAPGNTSPRSESSESTTKHP